MYCYFCMSESTEMNGCCIHCGRSFAKDEDRNHMLPGTMLKGKYMVGNVLGQGGFGITYAGRDTTLDIRIAIKEYYPTGHASRDCLSTNEVTMLSGPNEAYFANGKQRFLSEAKALAKFNRSSNIVHARDFFELHNTAYIIMDFVEGKDLKHYLREAGRIEAQSLVDWFMPILNVLGKVHAEGLIHRDISPDNIIVENGELILIDFGAARDVGATKSLSVMLKPGYAPGEQYTSDRSQQGPWTDIYAVCATMYECITGVTPQESSSRLFEDKLQRPSALGIAIPPHIEAALMHGMANRYKERPQNMQQLIAELRGMVMPPSVTAFVNDPKTVLMDDPRTVLMDKPADTIVTGVEIGHITADIPPQTGEYTKALNANNANTADPANIANTADPAVNPAILSAFTPPETPAYTPSAAPAVTPAFTQEPAPAAYTAPEPVPVSAPEAAPAQPSDPVPSYVSAPDRAGRKKFVIAVASVCALLIVGGIGVAAAISKNHDEMDTADSGETTTTTVTETETDTESDVTTADVTTESDAGIVYTTKATKTTTTAKNNTKSKSAKETVTSTTSNDGSKKKGVTTTKSTRGQNNRDDDDDYELNEEPYDVGGHDEPDASRKQTTTNPNSKTTAKTTTAKTTPKTTTTKAVIIKTTTTKAATTKATTKATTTAPKPVTTTTTTTLPDFQYSYYGDGMIIEGMNKDMSNLKIPAYIDGRPVRAIENNAFQGSALRSVEFPDTLETIGDDAFADCTLLEKVVFSDYGEDITICDEAFYNCKIQSLNLIGVRIIGERAFGLNENLKVAAFPGSVEEIGQHAFTECKGLKDIYLSYNIERIGSGCFYCDDTRYTVYFSGGEFDWNSIDMGSQPFAYYDLNMNYPEQDWNIPS